METSVLVHSILGTMLTIGILLTAYQLTRMLIAPQEKKPVLASGFKRSATWTVALFIIYFLWILIKRLVIGG